MKFKTIFILLLIGIAVSCKKKSDDATYPTVGLVSYFNFDDNLEDQLGITPDGTNTNGAAFVAGKRGKAISLNGAGQKIVFAKKSFKSGNNVSVSLWFTKPDSADIQPMVSCSDFLIYTSTAGATGCGVIVPLSPSSVSSGTFTLNTWTHFVATYDGTDIKLYINGALKQTVTHIGTIDDLNTDLTLAFSNLAYWKGSIDDLFLYNKALTQAEVTQLYDYQ